MDELRIKPVSSSALTPRMAVSIVFLCFGMTLGLWGGSVAEVLRAHAMSPGTLGSAFFGFSVAGILGMAVAGRIGRAVSLKTRLVVLLGVAALCLGGLFHVTTSSALIIGLFVFSFLSASIDLVMNSEALAVEHEMAVPVLASFHGLASLGLAVGSIAGSYVSVTLGLGVTALACVAVHAVAIVFVIYGTPDRGATAPVEAGSTWFVPSAPIVVLGLVVGTSIAGEMASTMFSAQTLASQAPQLAAFAGAGATAFALFQAAVRLVADRIRAVLGDERIIRLSLAATLAGFAVVAASPSFAQTAFGFAIVGIGTACIVPCGFAMSARLSTISAAAAISMLAMISALVRVPAPLLYGELAKSAGFAAGFWLYAAATGAALAMVLVAIGRARIRKPA